MTQAKLSQTQQIIQNFHPDSDVVLSFLDSVKEFVKTERFAELNRSFESKQAFPHHLWREMGNLGVLGLTISEEYGGTNLGLLAQIAIIEEISKHSGSIGLSVIAHAALCANRIAAFGTEDQKLEYLPKLASGEYVGALAMSEEGAGSDVMSMKLSATKTEGGYLLNGNKLWITNAARIDASGKNVMAEVMVVYAKTDKPGGGKGVTAFIVDPKKIEDANSFRGGQKIDKRSVKGSETWEVVFDNCFVPESAILGTLNKGTEVLMKGLNDERLILAGGAIGLGQTALEQAITYTLDRKQFNQPIAYNQKPAHEIANIEADLSSARAFAYMLAALADKGVELTNANAASAFLQASKAAKRSSLFNVHFHGGNGLTEEYDAKQIDDDVDLYRVGGGSEEMRERIIANDIIPGYANYLKTIQAAMMQFNTRATNNTPANQNANAPEQNLAPTA